MGISAAEAEVLNRELIQIDEGELLTLDTFQRAMPKQIKTRITQEMIDDVNNLLVDPILRESYRDNLLSFTSVMKEGKYKIQDYLNAVRYVSFKLIGCSNIEAYTKTFPSRFQRLCNEGADDKTIASYVTAYNKTQLVNKIMEQTLVPVHVLNADLHQKAINHTAYLMLHAKSEKVQADCARNLMETLKSPETQKIELDIGLKNNDAIDELRELTAELAARQRDEIRAGNSTAKDIAHAPLLLDNETGEAV